MFDIGWSEILVIMVVILIVVGPKDLPRVVRTFGQWTGKARGYARDFQRTIEEAAEENELAAVRKEIEVANRELADIQRQKIDLDGKVTIDPEPADPQAAQFKGGTTASAAGTSVAASAESTLKPAPSTSESSAPVAPAAGPSAAGTA